MYNSQVQLICPVLIYATRASFKSLIAVFLHQNPRTCGTISVNLDIGSTGARGGGMIWLEAKPKAVYCQKCSVCCCWRFRQSLKVFSDLLKMFRTSCFCISFAWHGASGFLQQRLTRCEFVHDSTFMCMLIKCNSLQLVEYFTYCCFLVLFFLFCRLGKLQDSEKKLCFSAWRSRSGSALRPSSSFWR